MCLAAFALACSSSSYGRRRAEDRIVSTRVKAALRQTPELEEARVEGKCYAGVVTLLGEVPSEGQRGIAESAVLDLPGVRRVNNLILVVGVGSRAEESSPAGSRPLIARAETAPAP